MSDAPAVNIRRPDKTWDGKPLGHVEKLEGDNPRRKALVTHLKRMKTLAMAQDVGRAIGQQATKRKIAVVNANSLRSRQRHSETKRAKA